MQATARPAPGQRLEARQDVVQISDDTLAHLIDLTHEHSGHSITPSAIVVFVEASGSFRIEDHRSDDVLTLAQGHLAAPPAHVHVRTHDLSGESLGWAVAQCEVESDNGSAFTPTHDDDRVRSLLDREGILVARHDELGWIAHAPHQGGPAARDAIHAGATAAEAGLRCFVAGRLSRIVAVPLACLTPGTRTRP